KEPIVYPAFYQVHPPDLCEKMFDHQMRHFCLELVENKFERLMKNAEKGQPGLVHEWLSLFRGLPPERAQHAFTELIAVFEQIRDDLTPEQTIHCDWLAGCLEYIRIQVTPRLENESLKTYLSLPLEEWPEPEKLPGQLKPRFVRLRHWRESPFYQLTKQEAGPQGSQAE
ncbi:MAG: hypothetical protein ACR2PT_23125, partial [Endozoicomonas sp.]